MFKPDKDKIDRLRNDGYGVLKARNILFKEHLKNKLQRTGVDRETFEFLQDLMEYIGIYK